MLRWLLVSLLALSSAGTPPVSVSVMPMVVRVGGVVRITCTVPRDPDNRGLEIILDPVQSSFRQLDGDQSRVTHALLFEHVPCFAESARCIVHAMGRSAISASQPLEVVGCDE